MDADVEAHSRLVAIEGGYRGHAGICRWWENLLGVFPDHVVEAVEVRELGDLTLAAVRVRAHGAGSGTPGEETVWTAFEWRDGKAVWWANVPTQAEALEAMGLREQARAAVFAPSVRPMRSERGDAPVGQHSTAFARQMGTGSSPLLAGRPQATMEASGGATAS